MIKEKITTSVVADPDRTHMGTEAGELQLQEEQDSETC